ncbi:uncharacterized protein ARB_05607 [Trichophyton benhamiae CBS 112371]|uniref:Cytochrome P450 n=1 Tax=Arthroderma benhamiae (strain ATCC MYA-4681 / CBS 112371) TaxID=663331 RepID=D4AN03_ARTBC|nr:uncharacterized protein ARB_05607 [Trichophyton benhamiae CBS 112371]EFE35564.1 hypothetical protein ARB_05607 [Trichophyton benhamiae CBS 112371]
MSGAYAGRDVEGLEDMIDERIQDFVEVIEQKWLSDDNGTNTFDIAKRVQFLAVDMITHICFGKPMGFVKTDSDVSNFLKTIESQLPIVQHFSVIIEINDLLHCQITRNEVEKRQQSKSEPKKDMLTSFMKHGLSPSEAETELIISLATLLAVASNPRVYARLTKEIDEAEASGKISSPIRDQEARRLPYLQACIKEGLRCFPPVAQLRERMVPAGGDTYNGQHILKAHSSA